MNTQCRVFKKLAEVEKVELSVHKVELALVDDCKDLIKRGLKIESDLSSDLNKHNGLLRAGHGFKNKYGELVKRANELGFTVPPELKKLEDIASGFIKKGDALRKVSNLF